MFNFFAGIADLISTVVSYVVNLFTMLVGMLTMIVKGQQFLFTVVTHLPPFIVPFCLAFVAFAIFFQVINKGS